MYMQVESPNKGRIGTPFKIDCPLLRGYKCIVGMQKQAFGITKCPLNVEVNSIVSFIGSVLYQRFHCTSLDIS